MKLHGNAPFGPKGSEIRLAAVTGLRGPPGAIRCDFWQSGWSRRHRSTSPKGSRDRPGARVSN